jgi:HlyD family secretion protein
VLDAPERSANASSAVEGTKNQRVPDTGGPKKPLSGRNLTVNPVKAGLLLAGLGAAWHVSRVVLVELGWSKPHVLGSLTFPQTASIVITGTMVVAFLLAFGLGHLWNRWAGSITTKRAVSFLVALAMVSGAGVLAWTMFVRPLEVQVARTEGSVAVQVFGLGTVEARVTSKVGFKVSGVLVDLRADVGDRVAKGAVLARLDDREQRAQVARAKAAIEQTEANLQRAKASVDRAQATYGNAKKINERQQKLLLTNATSVETADTAKTTQDAALADSNLANSDVLVAEANISDAKAQQNLQSATLDFHTLTAPYDAMVTARLKELGSALGAGEPVFTLIDPKSVWVLAYIDESRAGEIQVGDPAEVVLRSLPKQRFQGKVARIEPESDRVNEERRVEIAFDRIPDSFNLGEQAEVYIGTTQLPQALLVSEAAIEGLGQGRGTIWTVEDGHLQKREVTLGHRLLDGRYEIAGGLPDNAAAINQLRSGLRVGRAAKIAAEPRK